jgi:hypothetical protein
MKKLLLILVIAGIGVAVYFKFFKEQSANETITEEIFAFEDTGSGVSFEYPKDWELDTNKPPYLATLQTKAEPSMKLEFRLEEGFKTCNDFESHSECGEKTEASPQKIADREWRIGVVRGSCMNEADRTFHACTELKPSKLLIVAGYAFMPGEEESSENKPELKAAATKIFETLKVRP